MLIYFYLFQNIHHNHSLIFFGTSKDTATHAVGENLTANCDVNVHACDCVYVCVIETFQNYLDVCSYYCVFTYPLILTYNQMDVWVIGYAPAYNHIVTSE